MTPARTPSRPELIRTHQSLRDLNWWKVGGDAEYFCAPKNIEEVKVAWSWALQHDIPVWVISGGSNILIADEMLRGLTIHLHQFAGVESADVPEKQIETGRVETVKIQALAGTAKAEIAKIFLQHRLAPAIFLTGIPGDVGAGVVMNAGIGEARTPREFCEIVSEIEVLKPDMSIVRFRGSELKWEYRHSSGWQPGIITRVTFEWPFQPDPAVPQMVREQTRKRITTQPLDLPNCGSVFRNPLGHKAAQLIEKCGLKGFRVGGASVSTKHANFIVNDQNAKSEDIAQIIDHVRAEVFKQTGVQLETEVIRFS